MPMFDDPNKELRRLQEELLAEEKTDWVDDDLAGLDELLADYEEEFTEATEKEYKEVDDLRRMSDILLEEEDDTLYKDDHKKAKKQKQKGVRGLIVVACLETVAIIALLIWWLLWLR